MSEENKKPDGGLSIVIPNYNRETLVQTCLRSCLHLKYRPLQVIVVDDGSDDDSVSAAQSFLDEFDVCGIDFTVEALSHGGPQIARNRGIALSTQPYIYFLDSDDFVNATNFDEFMKKVHADSCEMTVGIIDRIDTQGKHLEFVGSPWTISEVDRILDYNWTTNGVVYSREFLDRIGNWCVDLAGSQDWELQVRSKVSAESVSFVVKTIAFVLDHNEGRVGTRHFRQEYTESVLIACGLNLQHLQSHGKASLRNQLRLAGRVSLHMVELRQNGVPSRDAWRRVGKFFPSGPSLFSLFRFLPWDLIGRLRDSRSATNDRGSAA